VTLPTMDGDEGVLTSTTTSELLVVAATYAIEPLTKIPRACTHAGDETVASRGGGCWASAMGDTAGSEGGERPQSHRSDGGEGRWRTPSMTVELMTPPTMLGDDGVLTSTTASESLPFETTYA
jgi:hypothetical protein